MWPRKIQASVSQAYVTWNPSTPCKVPNFDPLTGKTRSRTCGFVSCGIVSLDFVSRGFVYRKITRAVMEGIASSESTTRQIILLTLVISTALHSRSKLYNHISFGVKYSEVTHVNARTLNTCNDSVFLKYFSRHFCPLVITILPRTNRDDTFQLGSLKC